MLQESFAIRRAKTIICIHKKGRKELIFSIAVLTSPRSYSSHNKAGTLIQSSHKSRVIFPTLSAAQIMGWSPSLGTRSLQQIVEVFPKIAVSKCEHVVTLSSHYFLSGMLLLVNEGENCQWQLDNYPQPWLTEVTFIHKLGSGLHGNPEASYFSNMSQQQELSYKLCQEVGCAKGWVRLVIPLDGGKGSI